jgi:hypothetical protein
LLENDGLVYGYILVFADVNTYSGGTMQKSNVGSKKQLATAALLGSLSNGQTSFGDDYVLKRPIIRVADLLQPGRRPKKL